MKNKTNLIKRIRNIIVGNTLPANEDLRLDTSEGEKKGVLKYKGNPIIGGGGSSDYSSTKQTVTLFDDTIEVSPTDGGIYQYVVEDIDFDLIVGENYTVVFDGTSYDVEATTFTSPFGDEAAALGESNDYHPSFETYPFNIMSFTENGVKALIFYTNTEGSHTVEIKQEETVTTTTPEFKSAVDSVTGYSIDKGYETLYDGTVETVEDDGFFYGVIASKITFVEGDTYKVTFNGTEYTCKCFDDYGILTIGTSYVGAEGYDWSTYPFYINTPSDNTELLTNQEGSCTLKIEHITASTKTTPAFESMIQGIAGGGAASGCQIIYPDSISYVDNLYSQYNKAPEAGNIYFIPFIDEGLSEGGLSERGHLYPVHIDELTNDNNDFSGYATIIGTPIITVDGTLTALDFDGVINPSIVGTSGLQITYNSLNGYRLSYREVTAPPIG